MKKKWIERIEALERHDGRIKASDLVEDARDPNSPLHECFEWDNDKAAEAYRLEQARKLLSTYRVKYVHETITISAPVYIRDPSVDPDKQGYRRAAVIATESDMARKALLGELERVVSALNRARVVARALGLEEEYEAVVGRFREFQERAERAETTGTAGEAS